MAHEAAPPRREEAIGAEMRSGGRDRDGLGADRKKKERLSSINIKLIITILPLLVDGGILSILSYSY